MNKIIRDHYPARSLPEDLRSGLKPDSLVRVVIEEEQVSPKPKQKELRDLLIEARQAEPTDDNAVERIRKLRNEWED
jgi:hypothetical protein